MFEKNVDTVYLVDKNEPPSRQKLIAIAKEVAPWTAEKLHNKTVKFSTESGWLNKGMAVVSAHVCGKLTDLCIDIT